MSAYLDLDKPKNKEPTNKCSWYQKILIFINSNYVSDHDLIVNGANDTSLKAWRHLKAKPDNIRISLKVLSGIIPVKMTCC